MGPNELAQLKLMLKTAQDLLQQYQLLKVEMQMAGEQVAHQKQKTAMTLSVHKDGYFWFETPDGSSFWNNIAELQMHECVEPAAWGFAYLAHLNGQDQIIAQKYTAGERGYEMAMQTIRFFE